jgi:23S rRNA (guanosine2251-2'-O)-methyltransferase
MPKKLDTYSHYKKDSKKLDKKIKEIKSQEDESQSKVEGRNAVIELLKSNREINKVLIAKGDRQGSVNDIIKLCKDRGIVFQEVERAKLDELSETGHHQGVIAFASPIEYKEVSDVLQIAKDRGEAPFIVICDEIEDPHNLGALIRTAEIAGCHGLIIPKRRSCQVTEVVSKVSCGATEHLAIARVTNINDCIEELKQNGVWIYGTDGSAKKLYYEEDLTGPCAIVIGSEGRGMNKLTMKNCDVLLKIPMKGHITSLNASVSGGIVIFEAVKQRMAK